MKYAVKGIEEMYKAMKSERLRNFEINNGFWWNKTGKIPSVPSFVTRIENCLSWEDLKKVVPVLREIRFLDPETDRKFLRLVENFGNLRNERRCRKFRRILSELWNSMKWIR